MSAEERTVLVVEDAPDERSYLVSVLADAGYRVLEAADGEEAVARVAAEPPDLITLDITMPARSGVSVYRSLKSDPATRSIPVVVVTGLSAEFERFLSSRRQVPSPEGYLAKPVDHEKLLETVAALLG